MSQTRFAIIFVGRQGSSYLEGLLNSHPDARCDSEILRKGGPCDLSPTTSVETFLRSYLHAGDERAAGFKMPWLSFECFPETWEVMRRLDYKLIHLTRENKLDQFISFRLAMENSAWRSDFGEFKTSTITLDPGELEVAIRHWTFQDAMLAQAVRSFPRMHMSYEQLLERGYGPVLDFLDLPSAELHSPYRKQRVGGQSEIVANYAALKEQFSGSPWAHFFMD